MPRTYIRKRPERVPATEQQISRAEELIRLGKSKRSAANAVGISESCLRKRIKRGGAAYSMGRFKPTFDKFQEEEFVRHCKKMDERFFGLTINDLRRLAYEYAEANKIDNRFDQSSKMAGRDWVECFLKRHPDLVIRQSAATSLARAIGFNKIQVDRFYKNLKDLYEEYKFQPSRIYNVDETGMSTVPKKTPKVVSAKGKKIVSKVVSAERGITITAICCMNANGHYIPPAFIYPRKRPRDELLDGGPSQSICMVSDSGFVNSELFVKWLPHFNHFVHPTEEDPVLLILDNHSSHISLEVVKYARENNIVIVTLPPHGSHKLQPLDRSLFSPLKVKYSIECDKFMSQHPGRGITQYNVARLFQEAYKKVATLGNAESGFRVTGIYPFNDDLFDEADFAPSLVTDQMQQDHSSDETGVSLPEMKETEVNNPTIEESLNNGNQVQLNQTLEVVQTEIEGTEVNNPTVEESSNGSQLQLDDINLSLDITDTEIPNEEDENNNRQYVPVSDLSPLPRMKEKRRGGRVTMKSQIITKSPYKRELEEKKRLDEEKRTKKKKVPALSFTACKKKKENKDKEKPSTSKMEEREFYCPLCSEKYEEPPTEEWIKCRACEEWWHEQCTAYERGVFICDNCIDN